jgi:hypothetical protein
MTGESGSNGRVTMALLGQKLDYISERLDEFCKDVGPKVTELQISQGVQDEQISNLKKESRIIATLEGIAVVVGAFFGMKQ